MPQAEGKDRACPDRSYLLVKGPIQPRGRGGLQENQRQREPSTRLGEEWCKALTTDQGHFSKQSKTLLDTRKLLGVGIRIRERMDKNLGSCQTLQTGYMSAKLLPAEPTAELGNFVPQTLADKEGRHRACVMITMNAEGKSGKSMEKKEGKVYPRTLPSIQNSIQRGNGI